MTANSTIRSTRTAQGTVYILSRAQLQSRPEWRNAFSDQRKDWRYHEIVEDTIDQGFDYRYFVLEDVEARVRAIQPFFLLDQDLLAGSSRPAQRVVGAIRRLFPRCLMVRTLMVGSAAGEGHLDSGCGEDASWVARCLHEALWSYARQEKLRLIVLKEFPESYRGPLSVFCDDGFTRIPSLPMTRLHIDYPSFDEYMTQALSRSARKNLRRKFRDAAESDPIQMQVVEDVTPYIDEIYPLYLQVYNRSHMHFEKLTPQYLCRLGREMPDKTRFFIWRQNGKAVAFSMCMLQGERLYDEYLGLDYTVALDLHLYFYTFRDIVQWAMAHGYKWYCSSALNYDPKLHLRCELEPLDLYVAHTSPLLNKLLKRFLPLLEPTRRDKTLWKFPNCAALWADAGA